MIHLQASDSAEFKTTHTHIGIYTEAKAGIEVGAGVIDLLRDLSSNAGTVSGNGFYFAVKIDFQSQGSRIEYGAAVAAVAQMTLNFAADFGGQAAFEIFAD
ncbi:MAG TPA: hypothetical protein VFE02_05655 [Candidatus Acidoferrales bacterium]|nr:hypothetical protein [Candidatus Acidoferrales bacterium]